MIYTVTVHSKHWPLLPTKKHQFTVNADSLGQLQARLKATKLGKNDWINCVTIKSGQYIKPVYIKPVHDVCSEEPQPAESPAESYARSRGWDGMPHAAERTCLVCKKKISECAANEYKGCCRPCFIQHLKPIKGTHNGPERTCLVCEKKISKYVQDKYNGCCRSCFNEETEIPRGL